ncbi:MAG: hypothetical protein PVG45_05265 [Gammaproteobacteria bacterium]|jgi:hypothetical protein
MFNPSVTFNAFIARLGKESLTGEVAEQVTTVLRAEQHLLACVDQALAVARAQSTLESVDDPELTDLLSRYRFEAVRLMELSNHEAEGFSMADCDEQLEKMHLAYDDIKAALLHAAIELRTPIPGMIDIVEQNRRIRQMARQMVKAVHDLSELYVVAEVQIPETAAGVMQQSRM